MAIVNRSSVLALKVESTEGTPVVPTGATSYIPIEDDVAMEPGLDVLENAELKSSIGKSKSILGLENPTANFSLYLKASAVEGQAPSYGDLLEAAFGAESLIVTERDTVSGSSTTVVNVNTGEGAEFERGDALLIKDATNGYSIRPVKSISSDALTLGFAVSVAPATGVNLGKSVTYKPASSGHQTLSIWHYIGNGGAVQLMAGSRVTDLSISFAAGELINASYSLEGVGYYWNPITLTATDTKLDWTDDSGTFAATLTAKTYKNPHVLAAAIQTAMNDSASADTFSVTYSNSTGKFTFVTATTVVFSLLWNTGTNTANTIGDKLGFSVAADDTGSLTYASDNPITITATHSPTYDAADPLVAKNNVCFIGDATDNVCFAASSVDFTLATPKTDILSICAESGKSGSIIQEREATVEITALLTQYDAGKFDRFMNNTDTGFLYNFGSKTGGNWDAGKSGMLYLPTATITSYSVSNEDGLVAVNLTLTAYVDSSGNGEAYLSFV